MKLFKKKKNYFKKSHVFKDTELIGITFSPIHDLKTWGDEVGMTTNLLCDSTRAVAISYGAAERPDQERATRRSGLIGEDGKVIKIYENFDVVSHSDRVIADLS